MVLSKAGSPFQFEAIAKFSCSAFPPACFSFLQLSFALFGEEKWIPVRSKSFFRAGSGLLFFWTTEPVAARIRYFSFISCISALMAWRPSSNRSKAPSITGELAPRFLAEVIAEVNLFSPSALLLGISGDLSNSSEEKPRSCCQETDAA